MILRILMLFFLIGTSGPGVAIEPHQLDRMKKLRPEVYEQLKIIMFRDIDTYSKLHHHNRSDEIQFDYKMNGGDYSRCGLDYFLNALVENVIFDWRKTYKALQGLLPGEEYVTLLRAVTLRYKKNYYISMMKTFHDLDKESSTVLLMYGQGSKRSLNRTLSAECVWLFDKNGLKGYDGYDIDAGSNHAATNEALLRRLWLELRVDAVEASRRPVPRVARGNCEIPSAVSVSPVADAAVTAGISQALLRVADRVLPAAVAEKLSEMPVGSKLIVLPKGSLQKVPFGALPLKSEYIIDRFNVVVARSFNDVYYSIFKSNLDLQNNPKDRDDDANHNERRYLLVGDPDLSGDREFCWPALPFAMTEIHDAAKTLHSGPVLSGRSANRREVIARLSSGARKLEYIHFATHGMADDQDPADKSFLALAQGHLTGAEMRKLKFRFERDPIVVMSACHSGTGKTFAQGLFGLVDFWLRMGASQAVVSLWAVNDQGTSRLMHFFAKELATQIGNSNRRPDASKALSEAMRQMKKENANPAIWAAFTTVSRF